MVFGFRWGPLESGEGDPWVMDGVGLCADFEDVQLNPNFSKTQETGIFKVFWAFFWF